MHIEIKFKQKPTTSTLELVKKLVPEKPLVEALREGQSTEQSAPRLGVTFDNLRLTAGGLLHTLQNHEEAKEIIKICRQLCEALDVDSLYYIYDMHAKDGMLHQYRVLFETPGKGVYPDLILEEQLFENFKDIRCEEKEVINGKPFYVFYIKTGPRVSWNKQRFKEYSCSLTADTKKLIIKIEVQYYEDKLHGISYGHPCSPLNFKIIRPTIEEAMKDFKEEFERRGFKLTCEKIEIPG